MQAVIVPVTPFQQNCSIVWCTETRRGAIVDPGGEPERIAAAVDEQGVAVEKVMLTHGHIDHAGAAALLARRYAVPVEGPHRADMFLLSVLADQGRKYGIAAEAVEPDCWLDQGDTVTVGAVTFAVHHCPGHTPGHVIYFNATDNIALVGDVLFRGSIGRTDFPRGDHAALIRSIRERLWPLGNEVVFLPGHGPLSTFGDERRTNPFVADRVLER
ncbi:MAG: MBL fold metallo-hydrolase [Alphaproteobacteria bacterium]|nr:MBL fold metallo-hydrolase [Alphaproteobacteria bacterium]